jgi:hypothetical protein
MSDAHAEAVKAAIVRIDEQGRAIAASINASVEEEGLVGMSPATIRRVEELIESAVEGRRPDGEEAPWEFHVMKGGLTSRPFVTFSRYTGRVGPAPRFL